MDKDESIRFQMIRNMDMPKRLAIRKSSLYELRDADPTFQNAKLNGV